jgi:hypothetical protein
VNLHPIDYHSILAQIALDRPVDPQAEMARRFMGDGVAQTAPSDAPAPAPVDLSAEAMTRQPETPTPPPGSPTYTGGMNPDAIVADPLGAANRGLTNVGNMVGIDKLADLLRAAHGQPPLSQGQPGVNVAKTPPPEMGTEGTSPTPPSKFPGVVQPAKSKAAAAPVSRGTPAPAPNPDDQPLPGIEQRANISDISSADVQGKQETANAIAQKQIADQQQARIDRSDELDKAIQSNWQRLAQQHEDLINQYSSAQVDPNRVWNNMDTGHKILAGVSMFLGPLGGVANMIGGGPVGGIQNAINQDVQNQKDQIERTGKAAGMVGELMDHYSKMGMDTASATQMAVTTAQKIGEQRALQIASSFGGDRAHAALGQQFMKNDQSEKTIQDIAAGTTLKKAQANQAYSEAALNKLRGGQISGGNMVRDLDGNDGMARTPEIANAYNTGLEPARAIMQDVNDVEGARASGRVMNAGELKEYGDNLASHVLTLRGAKDNPRAMEMVDTLRKKPGEIFNFMPGKGWEQTRTAVLQMARDHDTVLKQDPRLSFRQGPPPPGFAPTTPRP